MVLWRVQLDHGGVGTYTHGPQSINIRAHTFRTTHWQTIKNVDPYSHFQNSFSSVQLVCHVLKSVSPYLPAPMFISPEGARGVAREGLVKEHGMLMAQEGYE